MSNQHTPRTRLIVYLDNDRYKYLKWLADTKRTRIPNVALDLLEKAVDAQKAKAPAPK